MIFQTFAFPLVRDVLLVALPSEKHSSLQARIADGRLEDHDRVISEVVVRDESSLFVHVRDVIMSKLHFKSSNA